jgi:DNA-directed RNA polymerase specialized sigma subunit
MAKNYVNNKDLREQVRLSRIDNEPTAELIKMWQEMAKKFSGTMSYKFDSDRDDCISGGVIDCYLYWRNYNEEKSTNCFAYFTQLIKNGSAKMWRTLYPNHFNAGNMTSLSNNNIYTL